MNRRAAIGLSGSGIIFLLANGNRLIKAINQSRQKALPALTPEEIYFENFTPVLKKFVDNIKELNTLATTYPKDAATTPYPELIAKTKNLSTAFDINRAAINSIIPPAKCTMLHQSILDAAKYFQLATQSLADGLATSNPALFRTAIDQLDIANKSYDNAYQEYKRLYPSDNK